MYTIGYIPKQIDDDVGNAVSRSIPHNDERSKIAIAEMAKRTPGKRCT